jgi:hypothetical protein
MQRIKPPGAPERLPLHPSTLRQYGAPFFVRCDCTRLGYPLRKSERLWLDVNSRVRNRECVHSIPSDRSRAEAQTRGTQSNLPRNSTRLRDTRITRAHASGFVPDTPTGILRARGGCFERRLRSHWAGVLPRPKLFTRTDFGTGSRSELGGKSSRRGFWNIFQKQYILAGFVSIWRPSENHGSYPRGSNE